MSSAYHMHSIMFGTIFGFKPPQGIYNQGHKIFRYSHVQRNNMEVHDLL